MQVKVGHVGKQHTNLERGPGNGLTDFRGDTIVKKSEKTYTILTDFNGNTIMTIDKEVLTVSGRKTHRSPSASCHD